MLHGHCLCGTLRYAVDAEPLAMMHCHCSMCRKQHGTGFATFVVAPIASLRWEAGEANVVRYQSSEKSTRGFCGTCGSVAPVTMPSAGIAVVPAANVDEDPGLRPQGHIFVGSKAPWYAITDGLPQFETYPPQFDAPAVERPAPELADGVTRGSCLCGGIAYEATGAPVRMMYCHCSRCRLGRSAAHGANVFYKLDQFRWRRGESLLREYKIPDARFHTASFCGQCGSKVPRVSPERGIVVVPAGSLDQDPGIRAGAHIFVADKAPWFDITGEVPRFAAMPPA